MAKHEGRDRDIISVDSSGRITAPDWGLTSDDIPLDVIKKIREQVGVSASPSSDELRDSALARMQLALETQQSSPDSLGWEIATAFQVLWSSLEGLEQQMLVALRQIDQPVPFEAFVRSSNEIKLEAEDLKLACHLNIKSIIKPLQESGCGEKEREAVLSEFREILNTLYSMVDDFESSPRCFIPSSVEQLRTGDVVNYRGRRHILLKNPGIEHGATVGVSTLGEGGGSYSGKINLDAMLAGRRGLSVERRSVGRLYRGMLTRHPLTGGSSQRYSWETLTEGDVIESFSHMVTDLTEVLSIEKRGSTGWMLAGLNHKVDSRRQSCEFTGCVHFNPAKRVDWLSGIRAFHRRTETESIAAAFAEKIKITECWGSNPYSDYRRQLEEQAHNNTPEVRIQSTALPIVPGSHIQIEEHSWVLVSEVLPDQKVIMLAADQSGDIKQIQRTPAEIGTPKGFRFDAEPLLLPGIFTGEVLEGKDARLSNMERGDVVVFPDGKRWEILAVRDLPHGNISKRGLDYIEYSQDRINPVYGAEVRDDRFSAAAPGQRDARLFKRNVEQEKTQAKNPVQESYYQIHPSVSHQLFLGARNLLAQVERKAFNRCGRFVDRESHDLLRQRLEGDRELREAEEISPEQVRALADDQEYEVLNELLEDLHQSIHPILTELDYLCQTTFLGQKDWISIELASKLERRLKIGIAKLDHEDAAGDVKCVSRTLRRVAELMCISTPRDSMHRELAAESTADKLIESIAKFCQTLENVDLFLAAADGRRDFGGRENLSLESYTVVEQKAAISTQTCQAICDIAKAARRDPNDPDIDKKGGLMYDFASPEKIMSLAQQGVQFITCRCLNPNSGKEMILGFSYFIPPGVKPKEEKEVLEMWEQALSKTHDTRSFSYSGVLAVRPGCGPEVQQKLYDRHILEQRRFGVSEAVCIVLKQNINSLIGNAANGGFPISTLYLLTEEPHSKQRMEFYFVKTPARPDLRRSSAAFRASAAQGFRKGYRAAARQEALTPEYQKYRAREDGRDRAAVDYYARQEEVAQVFTSLCWGAGNMSKEETNRANAIIVGAMEGIEGVVTDNSSVTIKQPAGEAARLLPGLHSAMTQIRESASENAVFIAPTPYNPAICDPNDKTEPRRGYEEIPGITKGVPIPLLDPEQEGDERTFADPNVPEERRFMYAADERGTGHINWDQEEAAKRKLGMLFKENGFRENRIYAGGGGAARRGLNQAIMDAFANPDGQTNIVLLDVRTSFDRENQERNRSAAEHYIDLLRSEEYYQAVLRDNNFDPAIKELREKMQELQRKGIIRVVSSEQNNVDKLVEDCQSQLRSILTESGAIRSADQTEVHVDSAKAAVR